MKNYEITEIEHPKYPWLHRIRALRALRDDVFEGMFGGYVQREENLAQDQECWIYGEAICCENACVSQHAALYDKACARGNCLITGEAQVLQNGIVEDHAMVLSGIVTEDAHISGDAVIRKDLLTEASPEIRGFSQIYGRVSGKVVCSGNTVVLPGSILANTTPDTIYLRGSHVRIERRREYAPGIPRRKNFGPSEQER